MRIRWTSDIQDEAIAEREGLAISANRSTLLERPATHAQSKRGVLRGAQGARDRSGLANETNVREIVRKGLAMPVTLREKVRAKLAKS